jgi:hypothetical protein
LLVKLAQSLSKGATIVEVGCYLGASSAIMANSNPEVTVHSFDPFDDFPHDRFHKQFLEDAVGPNKGRSVENIAHSLRMFPNVTLHKGYSPRDFLDWTQPIDLYFEDGLHKDPTFTDNINFWTDKLKVGGILAMHDHRPWLPKNNELYYPAVLRLVEQLKTDPKWQFIGQVYSIPVFRKLAKS